MASRTRPGVWGGARLSSRALLALGVAAYRSFQRREPSTDQDTAPDQEGTRTPWHARACVRQAVTLRVDYATADGRAWLGLVRNLSLQGMYIDSALRHVAHEVAPGTLLTVAFVLPSGRPCKLRAIVIHAVAVGVACSFWKGLRNRLPIWRTMGSPWRPGTIGECGGGHPPDHADVTRMDALVSGPMLAVPHPLTPHHTSGRLRCPEGLSLLRELGACTRRWPTRPRGIPTGRRAIARCPFPASL